MIDLKKITIEITDNFFLPLVRLKQLSQVNAKDSENEIILKALSLKYLHSLENGKKQYSISMSSSTKKVLDGLQALLEINRNEMMYRLYVASFSMISTAELSIVKSMVETEKSLSEFSSERHKVMYQIEPMYRDTLRNKSSELGISSAYLLSASVLFYMIFLIGLASTDMNKLEDHLLSIKVYPTVKRKEILKKINAASKSDFWKEMMKNS